MFSGNTQSNASSNLFSNNTNQQKSMFQPQTNNSSVFPQNNLQSQTNNQFRPTSNIGGNSMFPQKQNLWGNNQNGYNNQQNGNISDTEFKGMLNTYSFLYNSTDSRCLFKWPVFNLRSMNNNPIAFNGNIGNQQELQYLWQTADQQLNPDPHSLNTCLLVGFDQIQKRVNFNQEMCDQMVQRLDTVFTNQSKETDHKIKTEIEKKLNLIRKKNSVILHKIINLEKKLFLIAKKLKKADINLEMKMGLVTVLKNVWNDILLLDEQINDIKFMIDGNSF